MSGPLTIVLEQANARLEEGGALRSLRTPRLVVAIPFKVLRDIAVTPLFSPAKTKCIATLAYGHVMKLAMQYERRFWDEPASLGQRVFTDTMLRRVYHFSIDQPGPRGILMSFTSGADAEALGRMSEAERLRTALQEATKIWPEAPRHFEGGATKYWNEDPWIRGSYSFNGVGQARDFLEIARASEGRVHFAGEHTSIHRASMNGALESAASRGIRGREVTPYILEFMHGETGGQVVEANIALLKDNARVAGELAVALASA